MAYKFSFLLLLVVATAFTCRGDESSAEDNTGTDVPQGGDDLEEGDVEIYSPTRGNPCNLNGPSASCCVRIGIKKFKLNANTCATFGVDVNRMSVSAGLSINNKKVFNYDLLSANKVCVPVPGPIPFLKGCLNVNHVAVNLQAKTMELCTGVSVNSIVGFKFHCLNFNNGKLSLGRPH